VAGGKHGLGCSVSSASQGVPPQENLYPVYDVADPLAIGALEPERMARLFADRLTVLLMGIIVSHVDPTSGGGGPRARLRPGRVSPDPVYAALPSSAIAKGKKENSY
jgi:hypothetical protein